MHTGGKLLVAAPGFTMAALTNLSVCWELWEEPAFHCDDMYTNKHVGPLNIGKKETHSATSKVLINLKLEAFVQTWRQ